MILLATSLGVFIAQLDSQVVNLALRHIGADLHTGVNTLQWILDAYNLLYATLLLTGGTLGDLYGRVRLYLVGVALLIAGSVVCALAPTAGILIAGRAITGIGAALDVPISLAILTVAYTDPQKRSSAIGVWASCNGLAIALGPTAGGLLVDAFGWRSIFVLVVPLCGLTMALAYWCIPESSDPGERHLDPLGQGLAVAALGSLSFIAIQAPHVGFGSPLILGLAILFAVCAVAFIKIEARNPAAMVPLDLFRDRQLDAALAAAGCMTFGMYAMLFLTPLYLQQLGGASAFTVGIELLPMSVAFVIVSQTAGWLGRNLGPRAVMTAGHACMGGGLLALTFVAATPNLTLIEGALLVIGVGLGLNTAPVNAVAVAAVPSKRSGTASGLVNTSRMVGATLGIAILGAIYAVYAHGGDASSSVTGLRLAYLGGGAVEIAGGIIAFAFIRPNALDRK